MASKCKSLQLLSIILLFLVALSLWSFALFNHCSRCRVDMPIVTSSHGTCKLNMSTLDVVDVDLFEDLPMKAIEALYTDVLSGGSYQPQECQAHQRVAVVVPYRAREHHLRLLLKRLHDMLPKQQLSYQIFVIEQAGKADFNRGRLLNIGVTEALKHRDFDCFVFQDVDLLPENDRNIYFCDDHVRHLASAIDETRYHVMYYNYAGGVVAINKEYLFRVNGFANDYWGWGSEDDDFSARSVLLIQIHGTLIMGNP